MPPQLSSTLLLLNLLTISAQAAITFTGIVDKTKYSNTVTFTVTADPGAATTTATVDGTPIAVGSPVTVTAVSYHELKAESRTAGNVLVDSQTRRFIVHASVREGSEDGIPPHTPFRSVPDAPSAFVGKTLKVSAPAAWPVGMPVPLAVMLRDGANETVRLNGVVAFGAFPQTTAFMRRGWGSVQAPAATAAGTTDIAAGVNSLLTSRAITFEAAPVFTTVSGTISGNTTWPANSRIHVTGTLTVNAGVTLTVSEGTIVKIYTGTATNGTAAEIKVNGTLQVNGTEANPVVFCPDTAGQRWGGIELLTAASMVNAQHAFFTGSGEDENWTGNNPGVAGSSHQAEQMLFLVVGSGSGTAIGAQLHLTDCFCIDNQQIMNSKTNVWIDLSRTLYQRAITSGELNGPKLTIDRSALIEFPSETSNFVNDDNDGLYLTHGDLSITNTVIGFTKDDGVDSGGNGGSSPFGTINPLTGNTVTRFDSTSNWYEGTTHEGNSLSGTRNVYFTGCVFLNCGQGVEAGYSAAAGADGPNAFIDGCLFVSNMVGVRWGDNYGSGYNYNSTMEVKNSFILNNFYHDAFSGQWHPTQTNAWIYQTTALNTLGTPYFNVHDNRISQFDSVNHPVNTQWNPPAHAAFLAPFMPVPGSNVGVAISTYAAAQGDTSTYPGAFTARLSTFSSNVVSVGWAVIGKTDPFSNAETTLASGALTFQPGETLKSIAAPVATPGNYGLIRVALTNPTFAEVTGEAWYLKAPVTPSPSLTSLGATWKYLADGTNQGTAWRTVGFNDAAWPSGPAELGYGGGTVAVPTGEGDEATIVPFIDTDAVTAGIQRNATTYFRRTFTVADASAITALSLSMIYDDGGVVYLNGTRVAATAGMPVDPAYTYFTGGTAPPDNSVLTATFAPTALVNGTNTIAVEIHQQSNSSSDISFNLELTATYQTALTLDLTKAGGQPVIYWFDGSALLEGSADLSTWAPMPGAASPFPLDLAQPKHFYRLSR